MPNNNRSVQVDLSTHNTLSEQLANINLTQENITSILTGLTQIMNGSQESVDIELVNQDGSTETVTINSIIALQEEVQRLTNTMTELTNLNPESAATIVDESGEYKRIFISSFNKTIYGDISKITKSNEVKVDYESLIYNLMYPSTKIQFELPNDFLLVDEVLVKTFRFTDTETFSRVYSGMSYGECKVLSDQSRILGQWYEDVIKTEKREQRYYGSFDVLAIQSYNTDGSINVLLNDTHYSDANSIAATRELFAGDILTTSSGNAKYKVQSVDHFRKTVKLLQTAGISGLQPGVAVLQYLYTIEDEKRYLDLPIHGSEKSIVFFLPVNPMNGATGIISTGHVIDTSTLTVYQSGNPINFDTYFNNYVVNIGSYLEQLVSESSIPFSKGVIPDKPTLSADFFTVIQINKHLSENSKVEDITKLAEEKEKLFGDITNLNSQISTINSRINAGRYRSLADRSADENKLSTLVAQKQQYTALYSSLVNDITSKVDDDDLSNYSPKFRIRGFFPVQDPMVSPDTRNQYIIKYKIEYRYCSPNTDISDATTMKYTTSDGNEMHGVFSSWIEQKSPVLTKVKNVDGTISWASNDTENGDEININQVDIPINPGESVEIRVKALSEAGYPITFTESEWSDVVRIEFPASLQAFQTLSATVEKNNEDKQKLEIQEMLDEIGVTDHLSGSFKEQDKYFAHTAAQIASGYRSQEQSTISLFDYLTTLTSRLSTLESKVARTALEATIQIVDENNEAYTAQNFTTMQLYAGAYNDYVSPTDASNWGNIIEKTFYLKITNPNSSSLDLVSPNPGDLQKNVDASNKEYFYPNVRLTKIADTDQEVQYNGQVVYLRFRDVAQQQTGSDLYIINEETTPTVIPDELKDTAALDEDKNVMDSTLQTCKLISGASGNFIALKITHPLVAAYLADASETNKTALVAEFERISKFNQYYKVLGYQNAYSPERSCSYSEYDKYMIGGNSCGATLFMKINSLQNIQVNGSSSNSIRILNPGDTNAILIPIVFQFRMMDALGNTNGIPTETENIEYRKKVGIDMIIGQSEFKFDVEVIARLRSNSITETNATRVNQVIDTINYQDSTTPSII